MERTGQLSLIWSRKGWILLFAVVAAVLVFLVSSGSPEKYEASTTGQVVSSTQATGEILSEEQLLSLSNLYRELASSRTVLALAHQNPAIQGKAKEFDSSVSVQPEERVGVLSFSAETDDPEEAAAFSGAYAEAFVTYLDQLQAEQRERTLGPIQERIDSVTKELADTGGDTGANATGFETELQALQDRAAQEVANPGDTMRVVEKAVPATDPVSPQPRRDALLALLGALLLGVAAVYLKDIFFDRYASPEETARDLGLPILGEIPKSRALGVLEPFRSLRAAVTLAVERSAPSSNGAASEHGGPAKNLLITGAESGCGKSYVAAHLSRALASEGHRVLAVDADLRRPTLHTKFGVGLAPGLSDVLVSELQLDHASEVAVRVDSPPSSGASAADLYLLPAGSHVDDSVEWLSSSKMGTIVERLRGENDIVLFDSPPTVVVDPVVLARYVDGVVFVVDCRRTRRRDARRSVQTLRATGAPLIGFVFNRSSSTLASYTGYQYSREARRVRAPKEPAV